MLALAIPVIQQENSFGAPFFLSAFTFLSFVYKVRHNPLPVPRAGNGHGLKMMSRKKGRPI
jgi:hypothetical protein